MSNAVCFGMLSIYDYSGYCKYLGDILCIVCTQGFKSNRALVQVYVHGFKWV